MAFACCVNVLYSECAHEQHVRSTLTLTLTLTHTITAYSVSGNVVHVRILICATRQKPCRKRVHRILAAVAMYKLWQKYQCAVRLYVRTRRRRIIKAVRSVLYALCGWNTIRVTPWLRRRRAASCQSHEIQCQKRVVAFFLNYERTMCMEEKCPEQKCKVIQ